MGSFIFGMDGDDVSVFKRTVDFVNAAKIDIPLYNILTPFPGTKLYQRMEDEGRIIDRDWANYDVCHSVIQPKNMTSKELLNGLFLGGSGNVQTIEYLSVASFGFIKAGNGGWQLPTATCVRHTSSALPPFFPQNRPFLQLLSTSLI